MNTITHYEIYKIMSKILRVSRKVLTKLVEKQLQEARISKQKPLAKQAEQNFSQLIRDKYDELLDKKLSFVVGEEDLRRVHRESGTAYTAVAHRDSIKACLSIITKQVDAHFNQIVEWLEEEEEAEREDELEYDDEEDDLYNR